MRMLLDTSNPDDYQKFLKIKSLPRFRFEGRTAIFPDEYAFVVGDCDTPQQPCAGYAPPDWMFDYQRDITSLAIRKQKFCIFADCGLGKTPMITEIARHCSSVMPDKIILIVSPLMVVHQTMDEVNKFYGNTMEIERVVASDLADRLNGPPGIVITNYDALTDDVPQGNVGAMLLDHRS